LKNDEIKKFTISQIISNKKIRIKSDIKIKLNQILRDEIEIKKRFKTKYIVFKIFRIKFDIINNKIVLNFSQLLKSIFTKIK